MELARMELALSRPCLSLRLVNRRCMPRKSVTDGAGHDIPALANPGLVLPPSVCLQETTNRSPDSCPPGAARFTGEEEDPGSAFGPESVPLATGLVSVVYWVPGPFPGPTPRPAGSAP